MPENDEPNPTTAVLICIDFGFLVLSNNFFAYSPIYSQPPVSPENKLDFNVGETKTPVPDGFPLNA